MSVDTTRTTADTTRTTAPSRRTATRAWIAMYHSVAPFTECADDPYQITVTPDRLDEQLARLRRRGLRGVSMAELLRARSEGAAHGLVGLTFDDGYRDFVDHALPLLRRHDCTATLFVLPGRLDGVNSWDPLGPRKPLLDADGIRHAAASGMEVASHSLTHVDLTRADDEALTREVHGSRTALAELTGAAVEGFCYPYGYVDARVLSAVRDAGYRYACAIDPGELAGDFALPRVHIGQRDTPPRLWLKERLNRRRGRALPPETVTGPPPAAATEEPSAAVTGPPPETVHG
ncbi:polysaccharide deacetylase family protein [Streptomyces sp. NPDC059063]|uniref:polysaccharide deacetylase family protein n=1 Tax=unclassified Streptomyces TaxID=2593676 RepID=UPI0036816874